MAIFVPSAPSFDLTLTDPPMKESLETRLARAGTEPDSGPRALATPIHLASTYARDADGEYSGGFVYSRLENPTRAKLEEVLADLEGGSSCMAFASGMAAANALLQALHPGDRVLLPHDIYFGVRKLASKQFAKWGLIVETVDMTSEVDVVKALSQPAALVWIETPSNPQLNIVDIRTIAEQAHEVGANVVVDNTWSTPLITRPLELGADIVLHSVTKYLGGHSDVLGGALVFADDGPLSDHCRDIQREAGAVLDPFSAWLALRGIRTLGVRMGRHSKSAMAVAHFLDSHPAVRTVHYPGLESDPGHSIAASQMSTFGGMLSFEINGSAEQALALSRSLTLFANATSLGGTESLIEHRATAEGPDSPTPDRLLRLSVGLENEEDLISDLNQALNNVLN